MDLCDALERAVTAAPTLSRRVEAYVSTKVTHFDEHRDFFRIYLAESGLAACGAMDPDFRDLSLRQSRMLEAAIRAGVKSGEVRAVAAEEAAHAISDLTKGVILRRLMGWSAVPRVEKEVAFLVDFAKKALGCK